MRTYRTYFGDGPFIEPEPPDVVGGLPSFLTPLRLVGGGLVAVAGLGILYRMVRRGSRVMAMVGPASPGLLPGGTPIGPIGQGGSINIADLHPTFQPLVREWISKTQAAGLKTRITATLRTPAMQDALYAQGRNPPDAVNRIRRSAGLKDIPASEAANIVTNAQGSAFSGWHLVGFAFDFYVDTPVGYRWTTPPAEWVKAGELGERLGMAWGGRWGKPDWPHLEWHPWTTSGKVSSDVVAAFKAGKLPKAKVDRNAIRFAGFGRSPGHERCSTLYGIG